MKLMMAPSECREVWAWTKYLTHEYESEELMMIFFVSRLKVQKHLWLSSKIRELERKSENKTLTIVILFIFCQNVTHLIIFVYC